MSTSYAMMSSRVTPLVEEEGANVDRAIEARGIVIPNRLKRSYALFCLMVAASMAHMTWKWSETGKGIEKWRKIIVIAEWKMSLLRVAVSLYTSMMERIK